MDRRDRNDREPNARDEQEIDLSAEEWVEWGGEMIWTVGYTSEGTPYGLTQDEFRQARMADEADRVPRVLGIVPCAGYLQYCAASTTTEHRKPRS